MVYRRNYGSKLPDSILDCKSGSGKTTVGELLARELGWRFFDADDFHSEAYRGFLRVDGHVRFVHLKGTFEQVQSRLEKRKGHYMPIGLLKSQFETLEEPADAVVVEVASAPEALIPIIHKGLDL